MLCPGLPVGEVVQRRAGDRSKRSDRRGGPESETGAVPTRPDLPVGDWITLLAYHLGILGWPRSCALFAMLSAGPSLCWEAGL